MKRLIVLISIFVLSLSGCVPSKEAEPANERVKENISGVWISYSEINTLLSSEKGFEQELELMAENIKGLKIENVYIHIRANCDSLYRSNYFPLVAKAKKYNFDVFEYMIDVFHQNGISVHAWINPYRVSATEENISKISEESPAFKWLSDENTENDINVCVGGGIYLNPAESEVRQLVINGVREVASHYDVDGIHFDDYFYPTTDEEFDKISYEAYKAESKSPLSLADWRRSNVNALISGCYTAIKFVSRDIIFSVSPAADIAKNYNERYADVEMWAKSGFVDAVIPQLYFGFEYPKEEYNFENLLSAWKNLLGENKEVLLIIGIPTYKIATDAEPDCKEWNGKDDIIARQVEICLNDSTVDGVVYFSYSSLFSDNEPNSLQRQNLKEVLKIA